MQWQISKFYWSIYSTNQQPPTCGMNTITSYCESHNHGTGEGTYTCLLYRTHNVSLSYYLNNILIVNSVIEHQNTILLNIGREIVSCPVGGVMF